MQWLVENEGLVRLASFVSLLIILSIAELFAEARPLRSPRRRRWARNLGLTVVNTVLLRLLFPVGAVGAAVWAESRGAGLLHHIALHPLLEIALAIVLLDLAIWTQHVVFHAVPALFRLHRVHHADNDFDVTLGARFHPLEMVLSMLIKVVVVAALGAPAAAVVLFETILAVMSLVSHANVSVPDPVDRALRWFVVTPAMHSVHHSPLSGEMSSNFGFNLSLWDRLFGTYLHSTAGLAEIGLDETRSVLEQTIPWMLHFPFVTPIGAPRGRPITQNHLEEVK